MRGAHNVPVASASMYMKLNSMLCNDTFIRASSLGQQCFSNIIAHDSHSHCDQNSASRPKYSAPQQITADLKHSNEDKTAFRVTFRHYCPDPATV
jgi:hypothetical protein